MKNPSVRMIELCNLVSSEDIVTSAHEDGATQFKYKNQNARLPHGEPCGILGKDGYIYCFSDVEISDLSDDQWSEIEEEMKKPENWSQAVGEEDDD